VIHVILVNFTLFAECVPHARLLICGCMSASGLLPELGILVRPMRLRCVVLLRRASCRLCCYTHNIFTVIQWARTGQMTVLGIAIGLRGVSFALRHHLAEAR
jgi:hypothetical protein